MPSGVVCGHGGVVSVGDLLHVSALTCRDQRFACDPLHATLSAGACIGRQEMVALEAPPTAYREAAYSPCRGCVVGHEIATAINGAAVKQADPRRTATGPAPSQRIQLARGRAKGARASQKSVREARAVMAMTAAEDQEIESEESEW